MDCLIRSARRGGRTRFQALSSLVHSYYSTWHHRIHPVLGSQEGERGFPSPPAAAAAGAGSSRGLLLRGLASSSPTRIASHAAVHAAALARDSSRAILAYEELVIGPTGSSVDFKSTTTNGTATAVIVHGLLGSGRNWRGPAKLLGKRLVTASTSSSSADQSASGLSWRFLLVDLRHHAQSAARQFPQPDDMSHAAADLARLVADVAGGRADVVIGHSMGGKIALEYVRRAGAGELPVMLPQQLWVLDSVPGRISECTLGEDAERRDVERVIATLQELPRPIPSKRWLLEELTQRRGFTSGLAEWLATSLRPVAGSGGPGSPGAAGASANGEMEWVFNLDGAVSLYNSYRQTDLLPFVRNMCGRPHEEEQLPLQAPPLESHISQSNGLKQGAVPAEIHTGPKFGRRGTVEGVKWGLVKQPWHQPMQTQERQQQQGQQQAVGECVGKQLRRGCTQVHFVKGERSGVWKSKCLADLEAAVVESAKCQGDRADSVNIQSKRGEKEGCRAYMHVLKGAGHWVHVDNPMGLVDLMGKHMREVVV
ncbi:hypothetical protein CLOM_g8096 [Closterium sp. NIES-68]|nr:hypothetical protein CLOM_g8096 [Closterium sp. NIES-68]